METLRFCSHRYATDCNGSEINISAGANDTAMRCDAMLNCTLRCDANRLVNSFMYQWSHLCLSRRLAVLLSRCQCPVMSCSASKEPKFINMQNARRGVAQKCFPIISQHCFINHVNDKSASAASSLHCAIRVHCEKISL